MKGQSKVASEMIPPVSTRMNLSDEESLKEVQESSQEQEKLKRKRDREMGKVAAMLSATVMITDWTFPFLAVGNKQLSVSEWYPDLGFAVDKFFQFGEPEQRIVEFKQKAFEGKEINGKSIKYGYLSPYMSLSDLAEQLELT